MTVTAPRVRLLVKKWRHILGIPSQWSIAVKVNQHHYEANAGYGDAVAYVTPDEKTWEADLHVNAYNVSKKYPLEETIVHELLHVMNHRYERAVMCLFTGPTKKVGKDLVEGHTEMLARAFLRAHKR